VTEGISESANGRSTTVTEEERQTIENLVQKVLAEARSNTAIRDAITRAFQLGKEANDS
jgi:hypothetical protein